METDKSTSKRLHWFIEAILMEERKFRLWSHQFNLELGELQDLHEAAARPGGSCAGSAKMRQSHEAILARHKKLRTGHRDLRGYCEALVERLESGHFLESDVTREVEKLAGFYETLRSEHSQMVKERRRLLSEHQAVQKSQNERSSLR